MVVHLVIELGVGFRDDTNTRAGAEITGECVVVPHTDLVEGFV